MAHSVEEKPKHITLLTPSYSYFPPDTEETLTAPEGLRLHYYEWRPDPTVSVRGVILLAHGFGEHCGRYGRMARALNAAGYVVGGGDYRGMGRSDGQRMLTYDYIEYLNDLKQFETRLRQREFSNLPFFVYGHSMGGLIALLHAERDLSDTVAGTILSNPLLESAHAVPGWQIALMQFMGRHFPRMRVPVPVRPKDLTHDLQEQAKFTADPLILRQATVAWLLATGRAMQEAQQNATHLLWPTLWLLSVDDKLCSAAASRGVYHRLPDLGDHTILEYLRLRHELHNEAPDDRDRVLQDVLDWLDKRNPTVRPSSER